MQDEWKKFHRIRRLNVEYYLILNWYAIPWWCCLYYIFHVQRSCQIKMIFWGLIFWNLPPTSVVQFSALPTIQKRIIHGIKAKGHGMHGKSLPTYCFNPFISWKLIKICVRRRRFWNSILIRLFWLYSCWRSIPLNGLFPNSLAS